jgi:DNA-binding IclR family transcriptional regulator
MSLGACSAAVPVRVPDGTVAAALGIVVRRFGGAKPACSRH